MCWSVLVVTHLSSQLLSESTYKLASFQHMITCTHIRAREMSSTKLVRMIERQVHARAFLVLLHYICRHTRSFQFEKARGRQGLRYHHYKILLITLLPPSSPVDHRLEYTASCNVARAVRITA